MSLLLLFGADGGDPVLDYLGGHSRMCLQVFEAANKNVMIADWTARAKNVVVESAEHGYGTLSAIVPMPTEEAFRFYDDTPAAHVVFGDGATRVFEGRIEDRPLSPGAFGFTAFGYFRSLFDADYSALWSTKHFDGYTRATEEDSANYVPASYEMHKDGMLYIAPRIGEEFQDGVDKGGWLFLAPGSRQIKELYIEFDVLLDTNWQARILSFDEPIFSSVNAEWTVTTSGSGSATVTFGTARDGIVFEVQNNTGGADTLAGDTGDFYAKLTMIRVKTTEGDASGEIHADEIADALVAHIVAINSNQLNSSTGLIEDPNIDLDEINFEDQAPGDILTWLASLGDDSSPVERWQWQVWEEQMLRFQKKGTGALEWYIDLGRFRIDSTLDELYNSAHATYRDPRGDIRRTAVVSDAASIATYGIERRGNVAAPFTVTAAATTFRDAFLEDHKDITPRAWITTKRVFTSSGAGPVDNYLPRVGDNINVRNLPPTSGTVVDKIRRFRISRIILDCDKNELTIIPELDPPSLVDLVAANLKATGV